jgi:UPF0716 family protein affecting phage T7 exclusion
MARLLTLAALAGLAVAEVAAVLALVGWIGPTATLVVLGLDMLVGVLVMRWAVRGAPEQRGWRLAAGGFIALPGLVLDLVGLVLLVPGVQRWVRARILRSTESMLRRSGMTVVTVTDPSGVQRTTVVPGEVIPGEVVDGTMAGGTAGDPPGETGAGPGMPTDRAGGTPDTGPRVVRGEIVGPGDDPGEDPNRLA